jgi:hypothetical protein
LRLHAHMCVDLYVYVRMCTATVENFCHLCLCDLVARKFAPIGHVSTDWLGIHTVGG